MQIKTVFFSMFLLVLPSVSSFAADSYTKYDVNAMKQRVQDTKTQKKTVKVYAVCDDAAGKTGGKEYCIKDFPKINAEINQIKKIRINSSEIKKFETNISGITIEHLINTLLNVKDMNNETYLFQLENKKKLIKKS